MPGGGTRPENWWVCAAGRWKLDPKRSRKKLNLGPKRSIFVKIGSFCTPKDSFAVGGWEKVPQKDRARSCQSEKRGSKPRHICITHHIGSTPPPGPDVCECKTKNILFLIHVTHTCTVAFWHISNVPQGFHGEKFVIIPPYFIGRCYVPGYRPRSGLLTVMYPGVRLRSGLFTIVYPGVRPRSGLLDVAYPGVRARRGLLDVVQPGVRARWPVDRCVPGCPVPFTVWTNNDVVKSTNFSLMTT